MIFTLAREREEETDGDSRIGGGRMSLSFLLGAVSLLLAAFTDDRLTPGESSLIFDVPFDSSFIMISVFFEDLLIEDALSLWSRLMIGLLG